ncbi:amino acid permease [Burkholderia sp. Bp8963]|nr:amino acid permease [Burkholderia sp. Bp8963]
MALGTAIGVGLFLGSASAIKTAGPAILLSYALAGVAIFIIMRALGEMAVTNPVAGSFSRYAQDYLGPLPGYLTGWTYWLTALVGSMCEITAAGEARNPEKTLARAVNSVFWRVLIFYVGALFVIMSIYPWNQIGTQGSPFVLTFDRLGIHSAAGIVNFVVLTAALSSCNSNLYGTSRLLYNLALQKQAPALFARISRNGIPAVALVFSCACSLVGVFLNYVSPKQVFVWLTAVSTFGALWTWGIILVSHYRFRKTLQMLDLSKLPCRVPLFPYCNALAMAFLLIVIALMAAFADTRIAVIVGPIWIAMVTAIFYATKGQRAGAASAGFVARRATVRSARSR